MARAAQLNKVAAVVNGQVITMFDLQKNALPDLARARLNPNDPKQAKAVDAVLHKVLDLMIMDILIAQEAKRLKVSVSPAEVDKEIAKIMQANHLTKEQFEQQLARQKAVWPTCAPILKKVCCVRKSWAWRWAAR